MLFECGGYAPHAFQRSNIEMLCTLFGLIVATALWPWLGAWTGLAGITAAAALVFGLRYWPAKKRPDSKRPEP